MDHLFGGAACRYELQHTAMLNGLPLLNLTPNMPSITFDPVLRYPSEAMCKGSVKYAMLAVLLYLNPRIQLPRLVHQAASADDAHLGFTALLLNWTWRFDVIASSFEQHHQPNTLRHYIIIDGT